MNNTATLLRRFIIIAISMLVILPCLAKVIPWDGMTVIAKLWPTYFVPWDETTSGYSGGRFPRWEHLQGLLILIPLVITPITAITLSIYSVRTRGTLLSVDVHIAGILVCILFAALAFCPIPWLGNLLWETSPYVLIILSCSAVATCIESATKKVHSAYFVAVPMVLLNTICLTAAFAALPWIGGATT